jgi:hypothetical protein
MGGECALTPKREDCDLTVDSITAVHLQSPVGKRATAKRAVTGEEKRRGRSRGPMFKCESMTSQGRNRPIPRKTTTTRSCSPDFSRNARQRLATKPEAKWWRLGEEEEGTGRASAAVARLLQLAPAVTSAPGPTLRRPCRAPRPRPGRRMIGQ